MKRIFLLLSFVFLVSAVLLPNSVRGDTFHDKIISDRIAWAIQQNISNPYYNPDDTTLSDQRLGWAKGGYAMACLYTNQNISQANTYIHDLRMMLNPLTPTTYDSIVIRQYWAFPALWRMYLDTTMRGRMSSTSRSDIRSMMYEWVSTRSKVSDTSIGTYATSSTWYVTNTENHDSMVRTSFFLGCQALDDDANRATVLADGFTVDQHYQAWRKYFYEFFRQRAREGLNCEVTSQTYAIDDLQGLYNICDYAADPNLRKLAKDYLTLFWADYANDFLPSTGLRGASGTRWYHFNCTQGWDSLQDILYCYDWHDNYPIGAKTDPIEMVVYTSSYRVPDIVRLAGATAIRTPYLYTTRRFGKGEYLIPDGGGFCVYKLDANNISDIRRDTWWTKDYVMGGLSLRTDGDIYTHVFNQNRAMGILFDTAMTDRIIFDGNGTMEGAVGGGQTGYNEITGMCGKNCMVGGRDRNANNNSGLKIYIHDGPLHTNLIADASGWNFTQTGPYGGVGKMFVADADANDPTRNNELLLGDKTASPSSLPALTTGGAGFGGGSGNEAIQFVKSSTTVGDVAYATKQWLPDYNSVGIDLYFKSDRNTDSTDQILMNVPGIWQVYINGNNIKFTIWSAQGFYTTQQVTGVSLARWQHLQASVNAKGNMTLAVDGNSATPATLLMKKVTTPADIVLGNNPGANKWYSGLMDRVKITCPNMPGTPVIAAWNMDASYTKDVYVAFRIANKNGANYYSTLQVGSAFGAPKYDPGIMLAFTDMYSPVVFEANSAVGLSYSAFQNAVKGGNRWNWDSTGKHLAYTSLAGDKYEYWGNSANLPKINNANVNLNPDKTYDGPYLQGYHGSDTMTISYPGQTNLILNFNYSTSPKWDDYQTAALWHMDAVSNGKILDDDLEFAGRSNDLTLYNGLTVTTGSGGKFGEALNFDGIDDYGSVANGWAPSTNFQADLWIYPTDGTGTRTIINSANIWGVDIADGKAGLWTSNSNGYNGYLWHPTNISLNTWHHVLANCDTQGRRKLLIDDVPISDTVGAGLVAQTSAITVGSTTGGQNYFAGMIDDVKISNNLPGGDLACEFHIAADLNNDCVVNFADLAIFAQSWSLSTATDNSSTLALWHMDSVSGGKVLDDDAENPGRNNDLILYNGASITTGSGGEFGEALSFDGIDDYAAATVNWASQTSVAVDFWFKTNFANIAYQNLVTAVNTWEVRIETANVRFGTWDSGGTAHNFALSNVVTPGVWQHCTMSVDATGFVTGTIDNATSTAAYPPMKLQSAAIDVGNKAGASRYFNGLIDEVKITIPGTSSAVCGSSGYSKGDFNTDCYVDMKDLDVIADAWLTCSTPGDSNCVQQ